MALLIKLKNNTSTIFNNKVLLWNISIKCVENRHCLTGLEISARQKIKIATYLRNVLLLMNKIHNNPIVL